jgi:flagellin-specific chaperone FliS
MKIQQFLSSLYDYHTSIIATASATDTTINIKKQIRVLSYLYETRSHIDIEEFKCKTLVLQR